MSAIIPKLQKGQFSIIFAEVKTGIILTLDGKRRQGNQGEFYLIFNSFEEAKAFAENKINTNPEIECSIRDENGDQVKAVRKPWPK